MDNDSSSEPVKAEWVEPEENYVYKEEDSNFLRYVKDELSIAGLFDSDSDYGGMIGTAVLELAKVFSKQGHSGYSAQVVASIFHQLTRWESLTPITNNPDQWMEVYTDLWQSTRSPSAFSKDGGLTYSYNETPDVTHVSENYK